MIRSTDCVVHLLFLCVCVLRFTVLFGLVYYGTTTMSEYILICGFVLILNAFSVQFGQYFSIRMVGNHEL